MKIVTQNLKVELSQEITLNGTRREIIGSIAPLLVLVGAPLGTFTFSIMSGATTLFSESFTSADLKAALTTTDDNLYIFYPFEPNIRLKGDVYLLKLTAGGYNPTPTSFIGWGQEHENIQNEMDYTPSGISQNSLSYRIKIFKEGIL